MLHAVHYAKYDGNEGSYSLIFFRDLIVFFSNKQKNASDHKKKTKTKTRITIKSTRCTYFFYQSKKLYN